jgi:hypothetical protein
MKPILRYLGVVWQIFRKDIQVEWRGRQGIPVMLVFALDDRVPVQFCLTALAQGLQARLAAGLLWVSLAFSLHIGVKPQQRLRAREQRSGRSIASASRPIGDFFREGFRQFLLYRHWLGCCLLPIFSLFYSAEYAPIAPGAGNAARCQRTYTSLGTLAIGAQYSGAYPGRPAAGTALST